jgi:hypothetical protein
MFQPLEPNLGLKPVRSLPNIRYAFENETKKEPVTNITGLLWKFRKGFSTTLF